MDKTTIIGELKRYYGFVKDSDFADFLEISPQVLSNWKSRNTFNYEKICTKCVEINPEWLLTGKAPMLKNNYCLSEIPGSSETSEYKNLNFGRLVPLYDISDSMGLRDILKSSDDMVVDYLDIPNADCDGALYVKENNSSLHFKSGDIVLFKLIKREVILWGSVYLLDMKSKNENKLYVKHVHKSELGDDYVKLSDGSSGKDGMNVLVDKIEFMVVVNAGIKFY